MRIDNTIAILILFIISVLITSAGCEGSLNSESQPKKTFGLLTRVQNQGLRYVMRQGETNEKVIALTFDDGPDPRYTPRILDILKQENVAATFFMIGQNIRKYPQIARRAAMQGNMIENHSWDHPMCQHLTYQQLQWQLVETSNEISRVTGKKPMFFRPPRGALSPKIHKICERTGHTIALWTDSVKASVIKYPHEEARDISNRAFGGSIILLHDGLLNREKDVKALPHLIKDLKKRGFKFVTLDYFIRNKEKRLDKPLLTSL